MSAAALTNTAQESVVQIRDLRVHFPITRGAMLRRRVGWVRAVDGVTLDIHRGETLGLVGESGSGKTTLGRCLVRLIRPTSGSILFRGEDLVRVKGARAKQMTADLQMVFQDPYGSFDPRMLIGTSIAEPLRAHRTGRTSERRAAVTELLSTVGLPARAAGRYPHELSGGQRQRAGIARALAMRPALIVADEPVSALDVSIQAQILNLLQNLQAQFHLTYLFIAHDLAVVRYISDRVAVMYLGEVVELALTRELYSNPLHPYTIALLSAIPISDAAVEAARARIVLQGDPPNPANPPSGCRFHTRCWLRQRLGNPERCATEVPALATAATQHQVACHFKDEAAASPMRASVLAYAANAAPEPPAPGASS
jgi:oligopeptide/dipeptide ABC transporter ATP-binding protein